MVRELSDGEAHSAAMAGAELGRCLRWRRQNEKLGCEQVGQARVSVPVVAALARASAARGRAVRRPATGVTMRRLFSESVNTVA